MGTPFFAIVMMVVTSVFSALATFFIKMSSSSVSLNLKKLFKNWKFFVGLFFYGISTLLGLFAFKLGELSVLYPFVALQYVWTNFLSMRFLDEDITALKWIGVILIVLGVTLIGLGM
jgi:uncharacterized membrane protein